MMDAREPLGGKDQGTLGVHVIPPFERFAH